MARGRWVWDSETETLVPSDEYYARQEKASAPMIMSDIEPYRSMATGEMIGGRRQHREHLRRHDLIEIGNEKLSKRERKLPDPRPEIAQVLKEKGVIG